MGEHKATPAPKLVINVSFIGRYIYDIFEHYHYLLYKCKKLYSDGKLVFYIKLKCDDVKLACGNQPCIQLACSG